MFSLLSESPSTSMLPPATTLSPCGHIQTRWDAEFCKPAAQVDVEDNGPSHVIQQWFYSGRRLDIWAAQTLHEWWTQTLC